MGVSVKPILEAVLFVAEDPIPAKELAQVLEMPTKQVIEELEALASELESGDRGIRLEQVSGGWRLYTVPDAFPYVERFATTARATRLSAAALETLAVVAYRQPVSRGQVAEIRGVDSDSALRTLERRGLIVETDRLPLPGTPAVYGTSELFMEKLGINDLGELPPLADHVPPSNVMESLEATFRDD